MQEIGESDVVDIATFAGQKRWIFETPETRTDPAVVLLRPGCAQFVMALVARAMTSFGNA